MFGSGPFSEVPFCSLYGGEFVYPDGLSADGLLGLVTISADGSVDVTGLEALGFVGTVSATGGAGVDVTGLQAVGYVSGVLVWGIIPTTQTPGWVAIDDSETTVWTQVPT